MLMPSGDVKTSSPVVWEEISFWAMGTENTVLIGNAPSTIDDMRTDDWVRAEIEYLEHCWSRFRHDSELNRFLKKAGSGLQSDLSDELLIALDCCARLWTATEGLFDARVRNHLDALGYDRPFRSLPTNERGFRCSSRRSNGSDRNANDRNANDRNANDSDGSLTATDGPGFFVDLDRKVASVDVGVLLDFGGVGKGLAADLLAVSLLKHGAAGVCVSLGGDIRSIGFGPYDGGWNIPVMNPFRDDDDVFTTHHLTDGAMVMSTTKIRRWMTDRLQHHLIDPRTGVPSSGGVTSVAAAGAQTWWSEGVAKAALIAGRDGAIDLLERLGVDGWVFLDSGEVLTTAMLPDVPGLVPTVDADYCIDLRT